jgi:hypothetical protein
MRFFSLVLVLGSLGACSSKSSAPAAGSAAAPAVSGSAAVAAAGSGSGAAAPAGKPGPGQPGHGSALVGVVAGSPDLPACVPDGVGLPKGFPEHMPVPPEARAISSQPWAAGEIVRFAIKGTIDDALAKLTKDLPAKGFTLGKSARDKDAAETAFEGADLHGILSIHPLPIVGCDGVVEIQIAYAPGKAPATPAAPGKAGKP